MATTEETKTGNGTSLTFTIPYIKPSDIKIKVDGGTPLEWDTSTSPSAGKYHIVDNTSTITFGTSYTSENSILIYRDTNVDSVAAVFSAGSSIRAKDLNAIHDMARFAIQEEKNDVKYTTAEQTKLSGIDTGAKDDQTGAEIKIAYEAESNTNAYTDDEKSKLSGIAIGAEVNVQSDWSASSGDEQILNKPDLSVYSTTSHNHDSSYANLSGATFTGNVIINVANTQDESEGWFKIQDGSGNTKFSVNTGSGLTQIQGNTSLSGNLTVANITALTGILAVVGDTAFYGNTTIGDANTDTVTITAKLNSDLIPSATSIDLGQSATRFGGFYGTTVDVTGNITIGGTLEGDDSVDEANLKISNTPSDGQYLQYKDSTDELTWATVSGSSAGGANTIHLNDDVELTFGDATTPDLKIWHESSGSSGYGMIVNKTGDLYIQGNDGSGTAQTAIEIVENGGVKLKYQGANDPSLETTADGAKVTGKLGVGVNAARELHVHSPDTTSTYIAVTNNATGDSNNDGFGIGISGDTTPKARLTNYESSDMELSTAGTVALTLDSSQNTTFAGDIKMAAVSGTANVLKIPGHDGTNATTGCEINHQSGNFQITNSTGNSYFSTSGSLNLRTNGTTDALLFDTSQNASFGGNVGIGATADSTKLFSVNETVAGNNIAQFVNPSSTGQGIYVAAGTSDSTKYAFWIQNYDGSADAFKVLGDGTTTIGGSVTAPSVASSASGMRKMTTSTSAPSGGSDGDVWFKYTA